MKRFLKDDGAGRVFLLAFLLVVPSLLGQGTAWGFTSSGLSMSLSTDASHSDRRFTLGQEPIQLIMVIRNETTGPIATDKGFSQVELHRSLILTDPGGKRHELPGEEKAHKMTQPFPYGGQLWLLAEELETNWARSVTINDLTTLFPMMKTTPGWYTIEAQQPFMRFRRTNQVEGLGMIGLLDDAYLWNGTVDSGKIQILVSPAQNGAQLSVHVMNTTEEPAKPLGQVPVRVFRSTDLPPRYSLPDIWDQVEPVLNGTTDFDGSAVWDSGTPCLEEDSFTAVALYSGEYKESLIGTGEGWAPECSGAIEKVIGFVEEVTPPAVPGDLDGDGDVDRNDLNILLSHRNQPASVCPECDLDGDGTITVLDARKMVLMCTRPRCAVQ